MPERRYILSGCSYRMRKGADSAEGCSGSSSGLRGAPRWLYAIYGSCCNRVQYVYWFVLQQVHHRWCPVRHLQR